MIEREAETQAEGEAGSMRGARCGTRSRVSRITAWAEGRRPTAEPPRDPPFFSTLKKIFGIYYEFMYIIGFFLRFYLFMIDTEREKGRDTGRGRSRLHAGSPTRAWIPGLQDHTLGPRQALNG